MRAYQFACAAILAAVMPATALADDPNDPAMRNAAAKARDREIIRQLNLQELARVRERDARYAEGWRAWRGQAGNSGAQDASDVRSRGYAHDMDNYARDRARYERELAAWRRAAAACRAGDYYACGE